MTSKKGHKATVRRMTKQKREFIEAYEKCLGNISVACKTIGISRWTYYRWIEEDSEFAKECENVIEANIDYAETKLMTNIREGKETSLIFYLKTKGKSRGYNESIVVNQTSISKNEYSELSDEDLEKRITDITRKLS